METGKVANSRCYNLCLLVCPSVYSADNLWHFVGTGPQLGRQSSRKRSHTLCPGRRLVQGMAHTQTNAVSIVEGRKSPKGAVR